MKEFVNREWSRAERTLQTARQLVNSDPDSCVSRAYYAVFHALTAYFALREQVFSKHSALRAAVHRDLVRGGLFPETFGRDFDVLVSLRNAGDYGEGTSVSAEDAMLAVDKASAIVTAVSAAETELGR